MPLKLPKALLLASSNLSWILPLHAATEPAGAWENVVPALESKCFDCHGGKKTKGGVDLKKLKENPDLHQQYDLWTRVQEAVSSGDMPPDDSNELTESEKKTLLSWVSASLDKVATENAGDPGPVTLRRLTNAEYDNTIRDLTGIHLQLGKDFVPDGGGGEGFANVGDILFVSPQQLDKYFAAARKIADHAKILPGSGIQFSEQPVGTRSSAQWKSDTDSQMYFWYQKMSERHLPKDGEDLRETDYMLACWKWKHREQTGAQSLESLADENNLSLPFLQNWWRLLANPEPKSRYLDLTRIPWSALPGPDPSNPKSIPNSVRSGIQDITAQIQSWFLPKGWPVMRAQQDSDEFKTYSSEVSVKKGQPLFLTVSDLGDGNQGDLLKFTNLEFKVKGKWEPYRSWLTRQIDSDKKSLAALSQDPEKQSQRAEIEKRLPGLEKFLTLFGSHPSGKPLDEKSFAIAAPAVLQIPFLEDAEFRIKGQLDVESPDLPFASAQFKLSSGKPLNPNGPLPGVITHWKRQTDTHTSVHKEFRVLHSAFSLNFEHRLSEVAANRYRSTPSSGVYYFSDDQLKTLIPPTEAERLKTLKEDWGFVWSENTIKSREADWDKKVLPHLERFAEKAWRRPLLPDEKKQISAIFSSAIAQDLDRESAAREVIVRSLVAPSFLFKLEQGASPGIHEVSAYELAARLSYFLWASAPDTALLEKAANGSLKNPEVLKSETLRMLKDPKAEGLAREFGAQWFEFRNFDNFSKVDTAKFPEFTPELRRDFYEEVIAFLSHIIRENRPVTEILSAKYTFLNERLAKHYGIPNVEGDPLRLTQVGEFQRGGILGMGALLTKNSYPHRTSPVLRGNWLLHTVLGTPTPPPPNDVPKLDDSVANAKSLRERLEKHRADRACAGCHDKIDPLGFALESFDPIGRNRTNDDAGALIDNTGKDKEGKQFQGITGLRDYLKNRSPEFHGLFSRKLLGYALGRKTLPTDKLLLEQMKKQLQSGDPSFAGAVLSVVQSQQFKTRRTE